MSFGEEERQKFMYEWLWDMVYPRRCPICFQILDDSRTLVCEKCGKKVRRIKQPYCYRCGKSLKTKEREYCSDCEKQHHRYDRGFSIVEYDAATAPSILAIKYKNRREFLEFYGKLGEQQYKKKLHSLHIEAMIPIPISRRKRRKRGFNQAELFCKEIKKWLDVPIRSKWIARVKDTAPLKELTPLERKKELQSSFEWRATDYAGEDCVLLVDDIYTSGATVDACAKILKEHGIAKVYVLTMAIGCGNDS